MKRMIKAATLLLAICMACAMPALAKGNLVLQEEKLYTFPFDYLGKDLFEYYALVKNTGDSTAALDEGRLTLSDKSGAVLFETEDFLNMYPQAIEPGETGVIALTDFIPLYGAKEGDVFPALELFSNDGAFPAVVRFPASAVVSIQDEDDWPMAYLDAEVINPTGGTVFDVSLGAILRDAKGALISAIALDAYGAGVPSGGAMLLRTTLSSDLLGHILRNSLEPVSAEAFAFTETYDD